MLVHRDILKAVTRFASTDATRPALQGVHVPKAGVVEATDGHAGVRIEFSPIANEEFPAFEAGESFQSPDKPMILPTKALLDAGKATPRKSTLPVLAHVAIRKVEDPGDNGYHLKAELRATDLDSRHRTSVRAIEGPYPRLDQVMEELQKAPATAIVGLDAHLLIQALQSMVDLSDRARSVHVQLELRGELKAIVLRYENPVVAVKATAIVMPVRLAGPLGPRPGIQKLTPSDDRPIGQRT